MLVASSSVIKSLLLPRSPVVHVDPSRRLLQQAPGEKDEIIFPMSANYIQGVNKGVEYEDVDIGTT